MKEGVNHGPPHAHICMCTHVHTSHIHIHGDVEQREECLHWKFLPDCVGIRTLGKIQTFFSRSGIPKQCSYRFPYLLPSKECCGHTAGKCDSQLTWEPLKALGHPKKWSLLQFAQTSVPHALGT